MTRRERRAARSAGPLDAWRGVLGVGLVAGAVVIYLCLVGIVPIFGDAAARRGRHLAGPALAAADLPGGRLRGRPARAGGPVAGRPGRRRWRGSSAEPSCPGSSSLSAAVNLRAFLPNVSPELFEVLTFGSDPVVDGFWIPIAGRAWSSALLGAVLAVLPRRAARAHRRQPRGARPRVGLFAGLAAAAAC